MIIIRRHPIKFYFTLAFSCLFFFGLPILLFYLASIPNGKEDGRGIMVLLIFAILISLIGIYVLNKYLKNVPSIKVGKGYIELGKERYSLKEINSLRLGGKEAFPFFIYYPMEAVSIQFNDGTTKHIFVDLYSNAWELKLYLDTVVIHEGTYQRPKKNNVHKNAFIQGEIQTFKNPQLLSMRGLSVWGFGVFIIYLFIENDVTHIDITVFVSGFFALWFAFGSWLMHYPSLSSNYLILKNHNFFWIKDVYKLDDILEVVFETQQSRPNSLRVISKDYRNKIYPAGTLYDKKWIEFELALEEKGISVRNELILK